MSDGIVPGSATGAENRARKPKRKRKQGGPGNPDKIKGYQFKPGQSGNPGGRPKTAPFSEAARIVASLDVKDLSVKSTDNAAVAAAKVQMREALKGKTQAFSAIADRAEGRPAQQISGPNGGPVPLNIEGLDEAILAIFAAKEDKP